MKHKKSIQKQLVLGTMLSSVLSGTTSYADDVEVYISPPSSPVAPNVLFVLDESGSMWWGGPPSRMDQLKQAMTTILNDTANDDINAAILAYTTRTHPTRVVHGFDLIKNARTAMVSAVNSLTPLSGTPSIHALASAVQWYESGFRGYSSPIPTNTAAGNWCKPNYIVFLSDGSPNSNHYEIDLNANTLRVNNINPDKYRGTNCIVDSNSGNIYNPYDGNSNGGSCANEIGTWANSTDLRTGGEWDWDANDTTHDPNNKRIQNIIIHAIGMDMGDSTPPGSGRERFMKYVAQQGGGKYFAASNASQLSSAFQKILNEAKASIPYTYTAPAVPFDQNNAAVSGKYIYVPVFKPGVHPLWYGNIKKYKLSYELSNPNDPTSTKVLVLRDTNNDKVLDSSYLFMNSIDLWNANGTGDSGDPVKGGAASNLHGTRNLYTWINGNSNDLTDNANRVSKSNNLLTSSYLGSLDSDTRLDDLGTTFADRKNKLLDWLTWAADLTLSDGNGGTVTVSHKNEMGAPLHTQPVVVRKNGAEYVFVATTEGILHVFNGSTGKEEWAFMPADLLDTVADTFVSDWNFSKPHDQNSGEPIPPNDHGHVIKPEYGLDGPLVKYTTSNGHTYLVMGMRRGGRNYYALDITNPLQPQFAWKIEGGKGNFADLGQTWSKPIFVKLQLNGSTTTTEALAFGGGYDPGQDRSYIDNNSNGKFDSGDTRIGRSDDSMGNVIYLVDATTGALLKKIDDTDVVKGHMGNAIASDLLPVDINANGVTDRFYAAGVGGRIIRVDVPDHALKNLTGSGAVTATVVADVNGESGEPASDFQRFFNTPEVAYFNKGGVQYLALMIASGHRPEPLSKSVDNDRFYMIRDPNVWRAPPDGNDADTDPDYPAPLDESDLYNATSNLIQVGSTTQKAQAQSDLAAKKGWYVNFAGGEKGLSRAKVYDYTVIFTTYSGDRTAAVDACKALHTQGESKFYALDMTNGAAVFSEMDGNDSSLSTSDRSKVLKIPGMPPAPSLITPSTTVNGKVRLGGQVIGLVGLEEVARWTDRFHPIWWEEVTE